MNVKLTEPLEKFKEREIEIITLMAEGLTNKEIADQLFITKETVRWYNKQIYSKLGTSRRTEAIALAQSMGLIGGSAAEPTPDVKHVLPLTTGPFIGRNQALSDLTTLLNSPEVRLVSIIAVGGMGKSRLALELGHLIKDDYTHGAAFIDLTPLHNPDNVATFTASCLGLQVDGNASPQEVLLNYCRNKNLLLIFDNFEHLLPAVRILSDILEVAPNVMIITTSRERLNLRLETAYYLQPVSKEGGQLFIEVAAMMQPNIIIGKNEQASIGRIVDLVGGLPLGLILAATWVDMLSIAEIAEEIKANLDFLSAEMGDMPERQRSIHAVIDPTWKRLSDGEQKAFMWAAVFRGGFTRAHFQQVTGASLRTVQTLVGRSLIQPGHSRRYSMHPLLHQFAREKLESLGSDGQAKKAHLTTFLAFAKAQEASMYTGLYLESLRELEREQDNFRAALDWALTGQAMDDGVALLLRLCEFWFMRSQAKEAIKYLELALAYTEKAALLYWLGEHQARLGNRELALENIRKAAVLAEETAEHDILALANVKLAFLLLQAYPDEARVASEKAFAASQVRNTPRVVAKCKNLLGVIRIYIDGKRKEGLQLYEEAFELFDKLGDMRGISATKHNLAIEHYAQGDTQSARECCVYSLQLKRRIGDKAGAARRLTVLAGWDIVEESFERAIAYLTESRKICAELGDRARLSDTLRKEGFLRLITDDYDQAHTLLEQGLEIACEVEENLLIVDYYSYLGLLYLVQGDIHKAKPYIVNAIETDMNTSVPGWLSIVSYANYLWYAGEFDECLRITAVLSLNQESYKGEVQVTKYFLEPLVARLTGAVGDISWKKAVEAASDMTVEALFQGIVSDIRQ